MSLVRQLIERCGAKRDVELARTKTAERAISCAWVVLALGGGCSLALDTDREQCQSPADCAKILGGEATSYTCEQHLCQAVVECTSTPDCANKEGRNVCAPDGLCVECVTDPDCNSATALCVAGVCQDEKWGCLKKDDMRPPAAAPTATVRVSAIDALSNKPVPALTAQPCHLSGADPTCTVLPYDGYTTTYNVASGEVTITGVQTAYAPRTKIVPDASLAMYNLDLNTNRTLREGDTFPVVKLVPKSALQTLASSLTPPPDVTNKAVVNIQVHDCTGALASGVTVAMVNPPSDLLLGYNTEAGLPDFGGLKATTSAGTAGMLNVPAGSNITVVVTVSPTQSFDPYQFVPLAGNVTIADLYPGKFN